MGAVVIRGVALFTVTFTARLTGLFLLVSAGVKVTLCAGVPDGSLAVGSAKAKWPGTSASPPVNVDSARV